jgi:hypothetical protein
MERNSEQHKDFYEELKSNAIAQAKSETIYSQIFSTLSDIRADINEFKSTPKRRWDSLIGAIIVGVVGIMLGTFFGG